MHSLKTILTEQKVLFSDLGDRNPHITPAAPVDAILTLPFLNKIKACLENGSQSHKLWALTVFPRAITTSPQITQYLDDVFAIFSDGSQFLEYAAICCCIKIARQENCILSNKIFKAAMNRVMVFPAEEYVFCMKICSTLLGTKCIEEEVIPAVIQMLGLSEAHQHAAGNILLFLPLSAYDHLGILPKIINSAVIVNNYLQELCSNISCLYPPEWGNTELPRLLLPIANSYEKYREGCLKTVLSFATKDTMEINIYTFALNSINWARNDERVALVVLSFTKTLVAQKGNDFILHIREILVRLSQSPNAQTRRSLMNILGNNQQLVSSCETQMKTVLKNLSEDPEIKNKITFIQNFPNFFSLLSSKYHEYACNLLVPFFNETNDVLRNELMSPKLLIPLGVSACVMFTGIICKVLFLTPKYKYRYVQKLVALFVEFSDDVICRVFSSVLSIVNDWTEENPHALVESAQQFYQKCAESNSSPDMHDTIVKSILRRFGRSTKATNRVVFAHLVGAVLYFMQDSVVTDEFWPLVEGMCNDPFLSVQTAVIGVLPDFYQYLKAKNDPLMKSVVFYINSFNCSEDPFIISALAKAHAQNKARPKSKSEIFMLGKRKTTCLTTNKPGKVQQALIKPALKLPNMKNPSTTRRCSLKPKLCTYKL